MKIIKCNAQKKIAFLITMTLYVTTYSQISFQEHNIASNVVGAVSVYSADIDGDGYKDVISAAKTGNKIIWHKNNGSGNFNTEYIITTNVLGLMSIFAIDIDGDSDIDVLSADENKIAWYENTDGLGDFGAQQIISTEVDQAQSVFAIDIDGDGDKDVLSASAYDNKIAWYQNVDGQGTFSTQHIVSTNAITARSVFAEDIDGDGDIDIISASANDSKIAWYKNTDGFGNFGTQQIIATDAWAVNSINVKDIDADGDVDIIAALLGTGTIVWYKNTNGLGNFSTQQIITTITEVATSVYTCDIDNDGDIDVLSSSRDDNKIAWYENTDGEGLFGAQQIISNNAIAANSVFASDLNNDGKIDVLSASYIDNKINWYENQGNLSINQNNLFFLSIYPNPTSGFLNIDSQTALTHISVYNHLGQLVLEKKETYQFDISKLNRGIYFVKIRGVNGSISIKKVIKK